MSQPYIQTALLRLIRRGDRLSPVVRERIDDLKYRFPYDDVLVRHLTRLDLQALLPYLVWVPFTLFTDLQWIGRGGAANVYRGSIRAPEGVGMYASDDILALKEVDRPMLQEIILNVVATIVDTDAFFLNVFGLSRREDDGRYFLVMEFAEGGSLEQTLDRLPIVCSWRDVFQMAVSISSDLNRLHRYAGQVHRNLHPGNIVFRYLEYLSGSRLIDNEPATVITNFCNQKINDTQGAYGRLAYMPPEIFAGKPYTMASDVYSLGTILWQLVSRVPPRGTAGALFRTDGLREDPVPGTLKGYQAIINECWQLDPGLRPTVEQVYERLSMLHAQFDPDTGRRFHGLLSPTYLRALFNHYLWGRPGRKTAAYVADRVAEHRWEFATAEQSGGRLSLVNGIQSFYTSSMHGSRYYSGRQLADVSRGYTLSEPPRIMSTFQWEAGTENVMSAGGNR